MDLNESLRRVRKIEKLAKPTPLDTLEKRLEEIESTAKGKDDPSESLTSIRMRHQGIGPKRKARGGRDRMERGGQDRGEPAPEAPEE